MQVRNLQPPLAVQKFSTLNSPVIKDCPILLYVQSTREGDCKCLLHTGVPPDRGWVGECSLRTSAESNMDRLAAMETFVRVVDAGSFSSTAKQLRIGQPGFSKSVA